MWLAHHINNTRILLYRFGLGLKIVFTCGLFIILISFQCQQSSVFDQQEEEEEEIVMRGHQPDADGNVTLRSDQIRPTNDITRYN